MTIQQHKRGIRGGLNMDLLPTFRLGLMNAWWLVLPLVLPMAYVAAMKKEVARRMSDMTGYDAR